MISFIHRWIERKIRSVLKSIAIKEEQEKRDKEYAKLITLIDLRNYYDLIVKMTGKEPKVIRITKENFIRYNNLTKPYLSFVNNYEHYRGIPIEVIDDKKEEK